MKSRFLTYKLILVLTFLYAYQAYAFQLPKWFPFNHENALEEWQEKVFKGRVLYVVTENTPNGYLSAKSHQACSGLIYRVKFDPRKYPLISWFWKVKQFPDKENFVASEGSGWLEKDDYAARVYVIFSSWNIFNIKSLEYVWDEKLPAGTVLDSPYYGNLKLIVAESGTDHKDQWTYEERDIIADYKKAFGRAPRKVVAAIALMTDADNTSSTAEAAYKDIKVGYKNE